MDRSELTLYLAGGAVVLLLCLLVGLIWYKRRMDKIAAHIGGLPQGDVAQLHKTVADQQEMTRQHVSNVMGSTQSNTEQIKADTNAINRLLVMLMDRFIPKGPRSL